MTKSEQVDLIDTLVFQINGMRFSQRVLDSHIAEKQKLLDATVVQRNRDDQAREEKKRKKGKKS